VSNPSPSPKPPGRTFAALLGWLAFCFLASGGAVFVSTGDWYAGLQKPWWNPPPWIFGPVWTLLYIMMAVAAWMVWRVGGWRAQGFALGFFLLQWLLNALWTPLFFGLHLPLPAFAEIMALWLTLLITTVLFWRISRIAGLLLIPYLVWVSFAALLNFTLWQLNH
jgi:translocator protein